MPSNPPSLRDAIRYAAGVDNPSHGLPPEVRPMVKAIRDGVYDAYTRPGALSRLRYEAATGKGIPRNADDWRALQAGLQEFRNREDGTRSAPFEKPKEHDSEYAHAPPNSS